MSQVEIDDFEGFDDLIASVEASPEYAEEGLVAEAQALLVRAMADQCLSKAELAELLGVSRPRVSQMLSPECKNFTLRLLGRAAHALNIQMHIVRADEVRAKKHSNGEWCMGQDLWTGGAWHQTRTSPKVSYSPVKKRELVAAAEMVRSYDRIAA